MAQAERRRGEIAIRRAVSGDVPRIAMLIMLGSSSGAVTRDEAQTEATHPSYLDAFDRICASTTDALFVAELDGAVVGTFQVTIIPGLAARGSIRAKIESVHVEPDSRGAGIGGVMIAHALAHAKAAGARTVELTSNKSRIDAHRFYRNLGFAQSHEGFKIDIQGS